MPTPTPTPKLLAVKLELVVDVFNADIVEDDDSAISFTDGRPPDAPIDAAEGKLISKFFYSLSNRDSKWYVLSFQIWMFAWS